MAKVSKKLQDVTRETSAGDELATIDSADQRIKDSRFYTAAGLTDSLSNGESLDVLFRAVGDAYVTARVFIGDDATVSVFENPMVGADGALAITNNRNRRPPINVADALVFQAPVVISPGDTLESAFIPGGERKDSVGGLRTSLTWVFSNNDYLFRITNEASGPAKTVSLTLDWYEL